MHRKLKHHRKQIRLGAWLFGLAWLCLLAGSMALFAPSPAAAQSARAVFRVGVYNFKPLVFLDDDGVPQGVFIDVLNAIAAEEGWRLDYVPCTFAECLDGVISGDLDILPSVGRTPEREKVLDFTKDFLFLDWGVVYRRDDQVIETILDLQGKRIAALKGSIYTEGLTKLLEQFDIHATIIEEDEYTAVLAAANSGEADAGIITKIYGFELEGDYERLVHTDIFFSPVKIYFSVPKGKNPELLANLNKHLAAMKSDEASVYHQSINKWMSFDDNPPQLPLWVGGSLAGLGVLLLVSLSFSFILRGQVAVRTKSLVDEIQERKQAEKALRESEARYRVLFEKAPIGILSYDADTTIVSCNTHLSEIMEVPLERLIGINIFASMQDQRQKAALQEALRGRIGIFEGEYIFVTGGKKRYIRSIYVPFLGGNGLIEGGMCLTEDISERKRAENDLRQMNERFILATRAANMGVWDWDIPNNRLVWDDRMYELYGVEKLDYPIPYQAWLNGLHPDDVDRCNAESEQARYGEKDYDTEFRVVWPDGSIHYMKAFGHVIKDVDGEPIRMIGINYDVTERRQAEDALRESEERFRLSLKNAPVTVAAQDRHLRFIWAYNQRTIDPTLVLGKTDRDIFPPETAEQLIALKRQVLTTEKQIRRQLWVHSGGQRVFLDLSLEPMRDHTGQVIGVGIATVDLTQTKLAEEALRDSEARLKAVYNAAGMAIALTDTNGRWLETNPHWREILGYTEDELSTLSNLDITHPDDVAMTMQYVQAIVSGTKDSCRFEKRYIAKSGAVIWMDVSFAPLHDNDGNVIALVGAGADVTERKQAEEALRNSLAEKDILLREIHHRVKNNLASVNSLIGLQKGTFSDAATRAGLDELSERIRSMALIHELLYRSKSLSRLDMQQYLETLVEHLQVSYQAQIAISVSVVAQGVEMSLDHAIPCGLIVNELVTNAFKYAFPPGYCEKPEYVISIRIDWDGNAYSLIVQDNGIGLPAGFDWKNAHTLGLQLVILLGHHQLNGQIEIKGAEGTTFCLRFTP